jgi:hypothetical protein
VARSVPCALETEVVHGEQAWHCGIRDVDHVQRSRGVDGVVRNDEHVSTRVDVLVLEVRKRQLSDDRRVRRLGYVEHGQPRGPGCVAVVALEVHSEE